LDGLAMKKMYIKRAIYLTCWFVGLLLGFLGKDVGGWAETIMALGSASLFIIAIPLIFEDIEVGDGKELGKYEKESTSS